MGEGHEGGHGEGHHVYLPLKRIVVTKALVVYRIPHPDCTFINRGKLE